MSEIKKKFVIDGVAYNAELVAGIRRVDDEETEITFVIDGEDVIAVVEEDIETLQAMINKAKNQ